VAQARLPVRKIREVLRLKYELGLSHRKIAAAVGSTRSTVQECVERCRQADISWPLAAGLDELELHERLYRCRCRVRRRWICAQLHAELCRPGVTRVLLWQEYKAQHYFCRGCEIA
jgi:hypothetical protein